MFLILAFEVNGKDKRHNKIEHAVKTDFSLISFPEFSISEKNIAKIGPKTYLLMTNFRFVNIKDKNIIGTTN